MGEGGRTHRDQDRESRMGRTRRVDLVWVGRGWLPGSPGFFLPVLPPKPLTTGMTTSHMVIPGQIDQDLVTRLAKVVKAGLSGGSLGSPPHLLLSAGGTWLLNTVSICSGCHKRTSQARWLKPQMGVY